MSAPDPESITSRQKEVFMAALELEDAAARAAYLDSACGGDVDLRTRIERLLGLEAESREFLEPAIVPLLRDGIPPPGQTVGYFGDYVLLDEIARGSSGVVFRARQVSLDRVVALKMLKDGPLLTNDADVQRLHSEAKAAASLDHPHILPIYEVGAHEGQPYFSMKLIEGGTLQFRVAEYQRDVRKAVALLIKVARAVHHAHAKGILHRDLKPGNILLDANGEPLIADFGLARKIGFESSLTMTGQLMGTPLYMSPEQARGGSKELTPATDIYSLGTMLYELIEGRRPFQSDDLLDLIKQVAEKPAPAPQSPHRALSAIAMKCLEKQPAARYTTVGALADDLEAWLDGKLRAPPRWSVRWRWVALAAACAVLAFGFHAVRPTSDHVVTTTADELDPPGSAGLGVSLREAVRDAAPGVRITFATSVFAREGKITLDATKGEIVIEKNLELDASALPQGITLHSPVGGYRKLSIGPSAVVSVKRITFTAEALASSMGPKQGGAIYNEGSLTLQECRFVKNGGGGNGGAICTVGGLTMERCVFEGNETRGIGGAVYMKRPVALVRVVHCLFKGNVSHGNGGGAIHVASRGTDTQVVLEHCTLTENSATSSQNRDMTMVPSDRGAGGGIRVEPGPVEITHCIIAGNQAVIPGMDDVRGEVKQTGPNFIGGDPKDAPAGLGASVK